MTNDKLFFVIENGILRILIIGEIDNHSVIKMREDTDAKILEISPKQVVLDLSRVNFMDSSGIGFIIGRYRLLQELQAELVIENPNTRIFKILKCSGVDRITKIVNPK